MMSGPHGGAEPPAILIAWCSATNSWRATAVLSADGEPIRLNGPTNAHGATPMDALNELATRLLCRLCDSEAPATLIAIEQLPEATGRSRSLVVVG